MKYLYSIFILLTLSRTLHAAESTVFLPHMIDHINKGCPLNSTCSKENGRRMHEFMLILGQRNNTKALNRFIKKEGFPLALWAKKEDFNNSATTIQWDPSCKKLTAPPYETYPAISFTKSLQATTELTASVPQVFFLENSKLKSRPNIRDEFPLYKRAHSFIYLLENESKFMNISLSKKGEIQALEAMPKGIKSEFIACPKELKDSYVELIKKDPTLFTTYYCKDLRDIATNKSMVYLWPRSCP